MDNQGHSGQAWVTLAALGQRTKRIPFSTGVTCPTYRYNPAIVAPVFASLGVLYPGRVFLGVESGEALNEQPATGQWGDFAERNEWRFLPRAWDTFVDNPDPRAIMREAEQKVSLAKVYSQWIVSEDPAAPPRL